MIKEHFGDLISEVYFTTEPSNDTLREKGEINLYKLISKQLNNSNWRLVRSSLTYRMGYLTGKLKGYESDEDLRILLEKKAKK